MRRTSLEGDLCAIARSLDVIGDWWSMLIIRDAIGGSRRFSEFQQNLGAARNILTTRLRSLVEEGILMRAPASDGSAYQEYLVTEKGMALVPVLVALAQWGSEYQFKGREARSVPVDARKGRPLKKIQLRSEDGRSLNPQDVLMRPAA
jgi:DNA-binding HxlR family transcriptional regulator